MKDLKIIRRILLISKIFTKNLITKPLNPMFLISSQIMNETLYEINSSLISRIVSRKRTVKNRFDVSFTSVYPFEVGIIIGPKATSVR